MAGCSWDCRHRIAATSGADAWGSASFAAGGENRLLSVPPALSAYMRAVAPSAGLARSALAAVARERNGCHFDRVRLCQTAAPQDHESVQAVARDEPSARHAVGRRPCAGARLVSSWMR